MENEKLTIKSLILFFIVLAFGIIPVGIIYDIKVIFVVFKIPQIWIGILALGYFLILKLAIKIRNKYYEIDTRNDIDFGLRRYIDFEYNPSIAGFLFEYKLKLKDLSADILNLYAKQIVKIEKNENGKNEFYLGEKYAQYKDKLTASDRYIIDNISKNNSEFKFEEWRDEVKKEYSRLKFSEDRVVGNPIVLCTIIVLIILMGYLIFKNIWEVIAILSAFIVLYYIRYINIRNRYLILTYRGKKAIKDCIKLKRFMKEYTLLKDKNVEEIHIYENYIPYAVALGVNSKYEETMFEMFGEDLANIVEDINIIEFYDEK